MTRRSTGIIALCVSLALPPVWYLSAFISPVVLNFVFLMFPYYSMWVVAIALSVIAARRFSKWCYVATALLAVAVVWLTAVMAMIP